MEDKKVKPSILLTFEDGSTKTLPVTGGVLSAQHSGKQAVEFRENKDGKWSVFFTAATTGGKALKELRFTKYEEPVVERPEQVRRFLQTVSLPSIALIVSDYAVNRLVRTSVPAEDGTFTARMRRRGSADTMPDYAALLGFETSTQALKALNHLLQEMLTMWHNLVDNKLQMGIDTLEDKAASE